MTLAWTPTRIGPVELRNRFVKAATFEGMSPGGDASDDLVEFHTRLARGGLGMTTVAYCAVSAEGRTFGHQLLLSDASSAKLRALVRGVHAEGAKASLQLGHAGFFSKLTHAGRPPRGPSARFNAYGVSAGVPWATAMEPHDLDEVPRAFASAAVRARELGFDAVEVHLGHGYLLSQFLSPHTNRRRDGYGGSLEHRLRLPLEVLRAVRAAAGTGMAVLAKTNLDDGVPGGLGIAEAIRIAQAIESEALVDAFVPSGGTTSESAFYLLRGGLPLAQMADAQPEWLARTTMRWLGRVFVKPVPYEDCFFLPLARQLRAAVATPVGLLGGVTSRDSIELALSEGFAFVVLGRALLADPELPLRLARGTFERSRCTHCNECVAAMDRGGLRCTLPPDA